MRKFTISIIIGVLILSIYGCGKENSDINSDKKEVNNNDFFTNEFFEDIEEIIDSRFGSATEDRMESVISSLKKLKLIETSEELDIVDENGEPLYGGDALTFKWKDGKEMIFLRDYKMLTLRFAEDKVSFLVDGENLNEVLEKAYNGK